MKYALINVVNGNFAVFSEHGEDLQAAKIAFHNRCSALWGDAPTLSAEVKIVDENLDTVEGYREYIYHEPQVQQSNEVDIPTEIPEEAE